MAIKLMYITNNPIIARIADNCGVDWIFVDLEINGKIDRQGHLDTVISKHDIEDVLVIKNIISKSKLLVRVNPIFDESLTEINKVIKYGADIVMLPFFKQKQEVEKFIEIVDQRALTCLLLETPEAVEALDEILELKGIDYIHIGLNDLHLGYKMKFMFELLSNGTVEKIIKKVQSKDIHVGFGGIARLGTGVISSEKIIMEHYRLNSEMAILSRGFMTYNSETDLNAWGKEFKEEIFKIRNFEKIVMKSTIHDYTRNKIDINETVESYIRSK